MSGQFDDVIAAGEQAVATDFSAPGDSLLAAFGGIAAGLGMPPFEFFRLAAEIPTKKMFLRDVDQAWYQRGLPGISRNVRGTAEYLERQIAKLKVGRTVFVGNSMGGYAAILFGWLLNVDVVHAFAPQTFIGRLSRLLCLDRRWRREMRSLHRTPGLARDYFDLKRVLIAQSRRTVVHLYYADLHRLDRIHCRRLREIPNVRLHPYQVSGHNLIKRLRDDGVLKDILCKSLAGDRAHAA